MPRRTTPVYKAPKLVNGRGNFPINKSFKGVGTIRVSSGTTDPNTYSEIIQALHNLHNVGNLETLRRVKRRETTPLEVLESVRKYGVGKVVTGSQSLNLEAAITGWLAEHDVKESTRQGYRSHLSGFFKACAATDTIHDLVPRLEQYRKRCRKIGIARSFNQVRAALMAFAKAEYKVRSELYQDIKAVEPLSGQGRKILNDALEVHKVRLLTSGMSQAHSEMVWALCHSGLRIGEYMGSDPTTTWAIAMDRLVLTKLNPGKGNKGRSREVMLPFPIPRPRLKAQQFRRVVKRSATKHGLSATPHTFRKCFIHWMAEAGISRIRRMAYVGHGNGSISDLYERHEVSAHLKADAEKFRAYVETGARVHWHRETLPLVRKAYRKAKGNLRATAEALTEQEVLFWSGEPWSSSRVAAVLAEAVSGTEAP